MNTWLCVGLSGLLVFAGCAPDDGAAPGQPMDAAAAIPDLALAPPPDIAGVDLALAPVEGWPMANRDAQRRSRASQAGPRSAPAVKWTSAGVYGDPDRGVDIPSILVATDGTIFVSGGKSGGIDLLDPVDGHLEKTLPWCDALALGAGGTLYVEPCGDAPQICAVDAASGERRWCQNTPTARSGPVLVAGDALYVSFPGEVRALAMKDGALRWRTALDARYGLALAPGGNLVAAGAVEANAIEALGGRVVWTAKEAGYLKLLTAPSIGLDGTVYVVHDLKGGYVVNVTALHPGSGARLWASDLHVNGWSVFAGPPAVAADGSLRVTGDKAVALSPRGERLWSVDTFAGGNAPLVDADGAAYVAFQQKLLALSDEGKERWSVSVDAMGGPILLLRGGVLLVRGAQDGKLRAIGE